MIQNDLMIKLTSTAHDGATVRRNNMKFLVGLFQNASKNKEKTVEDAEAIKIIKNLYKSMIDLTIPKILESKGKWSSEYAEAIDFTALCEEILPKQASEADIRAFVDTIDFTQFKNKMQAIGVVTKHFNGNVDGALVKDIILARG